MKSEGDSIVRRIVVEYGRQYVYVMFTDGNARLLDEEVWKQPYRLDRQEAIDEAQDAYDLMYSHLQDTVLFSASNADEGDSVDSPEQE